MSDFTLLRPELLWLAVILIPLLILSTRRLTAISPLRRNSAAALQSFSVFLLLFALAEPVLIKPDDNLSLVVVLDASDSLSPQSRSEAVAYAQGVLSSASPDDDLRFVAAGNRPTIVTPEQVTSGTWLPAETQAAQVSDLAAGLRLAGSLLGDEGRRRIVLVTDGWETRGDLAAESTAIAARGIDLQVAALTALGNPEVVVQSLTTQPFARVGDNVLSDLRVYSTEATSATVTIAVDGNRTSNRTVSLQPGDNSIPIEQRATATGFHRIEATISTEADTSTENNTAIAALVVKQQPNVLLIEERAGEAAPLAAALRERQFSVDTFFPVAIHPQLSDLAAYDAVVLVNVAATSFTLDQQRTLQEYVRRNGRGLVAIGGPTAFGKGDYLNSVFEEVLPVSSQPAPRPKEGTTAIILVIDKSSSMREESGNSNVSKFSMAISAARLAVDSLREGDTVGIVAFDGGYEWALPVETMRAASDKDRIKDVISSIEIGRTTFIYPALEAAIQTMSGVTAPTRHIVLLTDGRDTRFGDYDPLLQQLRSNNINLSAIGIGSDADRELLTRLAREGRGRYYFTEQPENVPKIVFKEIDLTLSEATLEGAIQPHLSAPSPILRGLSPQDLPQLQGYDITIPKDEALIALNSDAGDPILAHWTYGLGRVVAYTSEAGPGWGANWLSWPDFGRFWSQAIRWSMSSPVNRLLQPSVKFTENPESPDGVGEAHISVESLNADNSFADLADITVGLRSPSGVVTTTLLTQTAPGRYEAAIPVGERGGYEVRIRRTSDGSDPAGETIGFSVPTGSEYLRAGTNDRLLKSLNSGAEYYRQPSQALDTVGLEGASPERDALWPYLVAPALLLLLASVAVRRIDLRGRRN